MLPALLIPLQGPVDPNIDPKVTAPTSVHVWVIPAEGVSRHLKELQTIKQPISPPTPPDGLSKTAQTVLDLLGKSAAEHHLVIQLSETVGKGGQEGIHGYFHEGFHEEMHGGTNEDGVNEISNEHRLDIVMQPDTSLLPDIGSRWSDEGWEKRAAIPIDHGQHLLYTLAKGGSLTLNPCTGSQVYGDLFLMKLSDATYNDGRQFYVDVCEEDEELIKTLDSADSRGRKAKSVET